MFSGVTCPTCHKILPTIDKLGGVLKKLGIGTGRLVLDYAPEYSKVFNIMEVPTFYFFAPGQEAQRYRGNGDIRQMLLFVLDNQIGEKQVHHLRNRKSVENIFNKNNTLPLLLLLSNKEVTPPLFKQICYMNRRDIQCIFCSSSYSSLSTLQEKIKEIASIEASQIKFPSIFFIKKCASDYLSIYEGDNNYKELSEFIKEKLSESCDEREEMKKEEDKDDIKKRSREEHSENKEIKEEEKRDEEGLEEKRGLNVLFKKREEKKDDL